MTSAGDHVVPQLIRAFRDAHPELDIDLHIGNRREVFAGLLDHWADVAITGRVPDDERLRGEAFGVNEIVLVTAPDDPAREAALGGGRGAGVAALAAARARVGLAGDGGGVAAPARARAVGADARLEHRGARGGARGARDRARVADVGGAGAAHGPARHDPPARRAAAAAVVRRALDGRAVAAGGGRVRGLPRRRGRRGRCCSGCWRCVSAQCVVGVANVNTSIEGGGFDGAGGARGRLLRDDLGMRGQDATGLRGEPCRRRLA